MKPYVPIKRRFALSEKQELRDAEHLSLFGSRTEGLFSWADLLHQNSVVELSEGRLGKTREFNEQVSKLKASGDFAFFISLERLHDEEFEDALFEQDHEAFEAWKQSPSDLGYFLDALDALDALKLIDGSLRKALNQVVLSTVYIRAPKCQYQLYY